jgi:hypothetical protein
MDFRVLTSTSYAEFNVKVNFNFRILRTLVLAMCPSSDGRYLLYFLSLSTNEAGPVTRILTPLPSKVRS